MRLWDLRDLTKDVGSFSSRTTYSGRSDGVRDVKWSPTDGVQFAMSTDSGYIQKWDWTMMKAPKIKLVAHSKTCHTIDWHADGTHLMSASADKTVKVWDFKADGKQQKARWEIKTPFPVRLARWRPPCQSSLPEDSGARQCTQVVTVYDTENPMVHIWDFRRPLLPFRELACHDTAPTDLLWHSQDLIWSVGREGTFQQSDVKYAQKIMDKRPMQACSVSPLGEVHLASQRRQSPPKHSMDYDARTSLGERSLTPDGPGERFSRGSADDSLDESFLSTSYTKRRRHMRTGSYKGSRSLADTVSSTEQTNTKKERILDLGIVMSRRKTFKPGQLAARGPVPGSTNALLLMYFAQKYKARPYSDPPTVEALLSVHEILEHNAHFAQQASMYRMAQSWRIAGLAIKTELHRRALRAREVRLQNGLSVRRSITGDSPIVKKARKYLTSERRNSSKPTTPIARPFQTSGNLHVGGGESTSNVPTPLARPRESNGSSFQHGLAPLPDLEKDEGLTLPPSLASHSNIASGDQKEDAKPDMRSDDSRSSKHAWDGPPQSQHEKRTLMNNWRSQPKEPLNIEPVGMEGMQMPPRLFKHDSDESFGMFPSVSDSKGASLPRSYASSQSQVMDAVRDQLENSNEQHTIDYGSTSSSDFMSSDNEAPHVRHQSSDIVSSPMLIIIPSHVHANAD